MNLKFLETIKDKQFILCNRNGDELLTIQHRDEELNINLNDIWELSFTTDNLNVRNNRENNYFSLITKDRIIKIEDVGEFIIDDCPESDNGISKTKNITCKSIDFDIARKNISYMECKAYKFYDALPENIPNTFLGIILNYLPNWTIGEVDTELYGKYRIFDISSATSIYNLMIENAQSAYECIFQFDRINKSINAYTKENIVKDTDIFVSFDNLMNELNIKPLSDGLVTALRVTGANDMGIALVNPIGTDTIYNLDNIVDKVDDKTGIREMTLETANAWKAWKAKYEELKVSYADNLTSMKDIKAQILTYNAQISVLDAEIKGLNTAIASFDTLDEDKTDLVNQYNIKVAERRNIKNNLASFKTQLSDLETQLKTTNTTLKFSNFFTEEQIKELDNFIKYAEYSDENFAITDSMTDVEVQEMTQELFDKGIRQLEFLSQYRYSFDIDMLCPLFVDKFDMFKDQLELGCQITLKDSKGNFYYPILIGMSISFDNLNNIKFIFSNSLKNQDVKFDLSELVGKTANVSTNLALNNMKYKSYVESGDKLTLHKMRTEALNTDMNEVINGVDKTVVFDDAGVLCRALDQNGTNGYSAFQSRLTEDKLIFTEDYWKHATGVFGRITAPNGQKVPGINTGVLIGDMLISETLNIHNANNSFVVDENGATLTNAMLSILGNNELNRILMDAVNGFKIQKKNGSIYEDMIYLGSDGNANFEGKINASTISGSEIIGSAININNNFTVDKQGNFVSKNATMTNANISGNINMTGGTISWDDVNTDPNTYEALDTANGVNNDLSSLKSNIGYTQISGDYVISPRIVGGSIESQTTIDVGTDLRVGNNIYVGSADDKFINKTLKFTDSAHLSCYDDSFMMSSQELHIWTGRLYFSNNTDVDFNGCNVDFNGANIDGLSTTAKFA